MRIKILFLFYLFSISAVGAPLEVSKPWANISDPIIMSTTFLRIFSHLPLSGEVREEGKFWSGDYWALKRGNINYRWNAKPPVGFSLRSPSKTEALSMTRDELSVLAPSEKYDLLLGNYTYPLKREVEAFTSPNREEWEGMCHGWAPALMHHREPVPRELKNPDGISVPFGSSDIKALVSYFYAYDYRVSTSRQMGYRCGRPWWPYGGDRCLDDMNAGAFHLVLANRLGLSGESFVADIESGAEVWNHVPVKYQTTVLEAELPPWPDSARGTRETIRLRTEVSYVFNTDDNSWEPVLGTPLQNVKKRTYEYSLDLGANGEILGGNWLSRQRPDFLWLIDKALHFRGRWQKLQELLSD